MNEISEDRMALFAIAVDNLTADLLGGDNYALEVVRKAAGNYDLDKAGAIALVEASNPHTRAQCDNGECEDHQMTIHYQHACPKVGDTVISWVDSWNCAVDGECPSCGEKNISPDTYHDSDRDSDCVDCD